MAKPGDKPSIWKKEITLRKKPAEKEQGLRVPGAPAEPTKPDSVAELLRPLAEQTIDPIMLPPVTPQVSGPVARPGTPTQPAESPRPEPSAKLEPEVEPEIVAPRPTAAAPPPSAPTLELPPAVKLPKLEPAPRTKPSRRDRKKAERSAEREAKADRRKAKQTSKDERQTLPAKHKQVVGLKIGGSQIAAAQVVNKGGPRIVKMARAPLDRGIVVGGELREPDELAAALKTFFRKNKLPRTAVRLGISNNRIGVRTFEISGIDDPKQLANAIRFRAQEALPIPLDEAVIDYRILDDRDLDGVRSRRVLLVVAHRELVDRYVTACRKAGLKLVGIDLEAFALLRALGDPEQPAASAEDAGLVCISIGHDRSTLAVSNGRVCEFTRVLAWGGSALDVALARVLDLTPSEAEPIKRLLSFSDEGEAAGLDARHSELARSAMSTELQAFARELVASLRFYQEQPGSLGIGEIMITGGGAACAGLAEELERLIGVTVHVADPLARVKMPRKLRETAAYGSSSMAVAVGLGIED